MVISMVILSSIKGCGVTLVLNSLGKRNSGAFGST